MKYLSNKNLYVVSTSVKADSFYSNFKVVDYAISNDFLNAFEELELMLQKNLNVFELTVKNIFEFRT